LTNKNAEPLKIYLFYCANSFNDGEFSRYFRVAEGDEYKMISLPCSGKADFLYLIKAFESGADGLVLITCPRNECHYLQGNLRASRRVSEVGLLLNEIGVEGERIITLSIDERGMERIASSVSEFCDSIRNNANNASCHKSAIPLKAS
jgi:F420-non-reducing hydrogenase iron-sulfur subunit